MNAFGVVCQPWCKDHVLDEDETDGSVTDYRKAEVDVAGVTLTLLVEDDGTHLQVWNGCDYTDVTPDESRAVAAELVRVADLMEASPIT